MKKLFNYTQILSYPLMDEDYITKAGYLANLVTLKADALKYEYYVKEPQQEKTFLQNVSFAPPPNTVAMA
jgi:hypothetical protein